MNRSLFEHYEDELLLIRKLARDFAAKYPAAAGRLRLKEDRSQDPHVERLIEAFALLAGRVRHKIHDEFPELTDAMLSVLYPHYAASIPSFAMVQMDLDRQLGATMPDGYSVPAGAALHTQAVGDVPLKFRTCYPLKLYPLTLTEAKLTPPPFRFGVTPHFVDMKFEFFCVLRLSGKHGILARHFDGLGGHRRSGAAPPTIWATRRGANIGFGWPTNPAKRSAWVRDTNPTRLLTRFTRSSGWVNRPSAIAFAWKGPKRKHPLPASTISRYCTMRGSSLNAHETPSTSVS
jgi:hypothetical protein